MFRTLKIITLVLVVNILVIGGSADDGKFNSSVYDNSNVLSSDATNYINDINNRLMLSCKAQIAIAFVESIEIGSIDEFAYQLFNEWEIGDSKRNNGVLYIVSLVDNEYYALAGSGLDKVLNASTLLKIQEGLANTYLMVNDYDSAAMQFVKEVSVQLADYYDVNLDSVNPDVILKENTMLNQLDKGLLLKVGFGILGLIIVLLYLHKMWRKYYLVTRFHRKPHYRTGLNPMHSKLPLNYIKKSNDTKRKCFSIRRKPLAKYNLKHNKMR